MFVNCVCACVLNSGDDSLQLKGHSNPSTPSYIKSRWKQKI